MPADEFADARPFVPPSLMVLVPGLGLPERVARTLSNVHWLRQQAFRIALECVIYVYKNTSELPLNQTAFQPCELIRHKGQWTEAVKRLPERRWAKHSAVLVWLADAVVPLGGVNLFQMAQAMQQHCLDVASLTYAVHGNTPRHANLISNTSVASQSTGAAGRIADHFEFQFQLFRVWAFRCLQQMIDPEVDAFGWSTAEYYPAYCAKYAGKAIPRIGLLDSMTMVDEATGGKYPNGSYSYREAAKGCTNYARAHPELWCPMGITLAPLQASSSCPWSEAVPSSSQVLPDGYNPVCPVPLGGFSVQQHHHSSLATVFVLSSLASVLCVLVILVVFLQQSARKKRSAQSGTERREDSLETFLSDESDSC